MKTDRRAFLYRQCLTISPEQQQTGRQNRNPLKSPKNTAFLIFYPVFYEIHLRSRFKGSTESGFITITDSIGFSCRKQVYNAVMLTLPFLFSPLFVYY